MMTIDTHGARAALPAMSDRRGLFILRPYVAAALAVAAIDWPHEWPGVANGRVSEPGQSIGPGHRISPPNQSTGLVGDRVADQLPNWVAARTNAVCAHFRAVAAALHRAPAAVVRSRFVIEDESAIIRAALPNPVLRFSE
jgi:hypothetical protein